MGKDLQQLLLLSWLVTKLILFNFLSLHQLAVLEITLFHIKLVLLQFHLLMVLSVIILFLILSHVKILSKFMLLGEINQMLIFMFRNLQGTSFNFQTWMEQLEDLLLMYEMVMDLKLMKQHADHLLLEIILSV